MRGCDVVAVKVDDVAPNGYTIDRATVRQRKTGRPVRFELTEPARQAIDEYIKVADKKPGEFLFSGRRPGHSMTTRQYARLLSDWLVSVDLDPAPLRHSFAAPNQSDVDLSSNRQLTCRAAAPRTYQDREHGQVSRH
jgi:integrase